MEQVSEIGFLRLEINVSIGIWYNASWTKLSSIFLLNFYHFWWFFKVPQARAFSTLHLENHQKWQKFVKNACSTCMHSTHYSPLPENRLLNTRLIINKIISTYLRLTFQFFTYPKCKPSISAPKFRFPLIGLIL